MRNPMSLLTFRTLLANEAFALSGKRSIGELVDSDLSIMNSQVRTGKGIRVGLHRLTVMGGRPQSIESLMTVATTLGAYKWGPRGLRA